MTKRVLVLMEVPEEQTVEGTKYSVEQAFGKDVQVHEVSFYPFEQNVLKPHYLDIYDDAEAYFSSNDIFLSNDQLARIAEIVGEEEADNGEARNNRIISAANLLGYLPEED
ncbi:hypothetical protein QTG56_24495 (plasmid) [Rossellomorea sp. AcN35-11]|nr:hypothetical protein [Rossellomorea aquimaris]WJV31795.1 hypothetical protein QTG56_24495 [Rossellomorea sp. AcN35-11]